MGDLSKHFSRHEFACHCGCGLDTVDYELVTLLEVLREHFHNPIIITSGYRCLEHNTTVGGKKNSYHLQGKAVDIVLNGYYQPQIFHAIDRLYPYELGLGCYLNFTHVDIRKEKARWGI